MNICTYVTKISIQPKEFMVALYTDSQTYVNVAKTKTALLQLLAHDQFSLVRPLGKVSALRKPNKTNLFLKKHDHAHHQKHAYLLNTTGFVYLEFYRLLRTTADHCIGLAKATYHKRLRDAPELTTKLLQGKKIIS